MIQCPSCGKDIADDSAHCGYCGSKVETGAGKKTMIGFAAVTAEQMREAAEEARKAREQATASAPPPQPAAPSPDRPSAPTPFAGESAVAPKLAVPMPGANAASDAKTAVMSAVVDTAPQPTPAAAPNKVPTNWGLPTADTIDEPSVTATDFGKTPLPGGGGPSEMGGGSLVQAENTLPQGPVQRGEVRDPVKVLIFIVISCGLYGIIWMFKVVDELNKGLGRDEFNVVKELLFTIVTCGLWGMWFQWRIANAAVELQKSWGVEPEMEAPILFILNFVYVGPLFLQKSLNNAWENGQPGALT